MRKNIALAIVFLLTIRVMGQKHETNDTIKKDVPAIIEQLVREYDRQVKASKEGRVVAEVPILEIDGIIIDESMSKSGREFYELFFKNWVKPKELHNYYLKVKERPFRMNITLIEVYFKDNLVYQAVLQRRYDDIVEMVKVAIHRTELYADQIMQAQKALNEK